MYYPFNTYAKFSQKLTFLTPGYAHVGDKLLHFQTVQKIIPDLQLPWQKSKLHYK